MAILTARTTRSETAAPQPSTRWSVEKGWGEWRENEAPNPVERRRRRLSSAGKRETHLHRLLDSLKRKIFTFLANILVSYLRISNNQRRGNTIFKCQKSLTFRLRNQRMERNHGIPVAAPLTRALPTPVFPEPFRAKHNDILSVQFEVIAGSVNF